MKQVGEFWLPDDDRHFEPYARCGSYQSKQLDAALDKVKRFDLALDIGAHVGFFSRRLAGEFKSVIAFEPQRENLACLALNCPPNVTFVGCALGVQPGQGRMEKPKEDNSGSWEMRSGLGTVIMPLDAFELAPDFVKIDVQGFEERVLEGAKQTLLKYKPVVLIEQNETNVNSAVNMLLNWGWSVAAKVNRDCVMVCE